MKAQSLCYIVSWVALTVIAALAAAAFFAPSWCHWCLSVGILIASGVAAGGKWLALQQTKKHAASEYLRGRREYREDAQRRILNDN